MSTAIAVVVIVLLVGGAILQPLATLMSRRFPRNPSERDDTTR